MSKRDYRENRVKVSVEIERTIFDLMLREKDTERKRKHPAKWYQREVAKELKLADKDNPSLRSYESKIQPLRKAFQAKNPQDESWSMVTLDEHPIHPEAIPAVLNVWKLRTEVGGTFTIREAKWAGRLSALLTEGTWTLSAWSHSYAQTELYYQLAGRPFSSAGLDTLLMGLPLTGDLDYFPVLTDPGDGLEQRIQHLTEGKRKELKKEGKLQ